MTPSAHEEGLTSVCPLVDTTGTAACRNRPQHDWVGFFTALRFTAKEGALEMRQ